MKLVGENAARDELSLELGGLVCPELAVEMGVRPRRELCRLLELFQAEFCALVLREPEDVVGLMLGKEGSFAEEGEGWLIGTARPLRMMIARCVA